MSDDTITGGATELPHGWGRYCHNKCRCVVCVTAAREYKSDRRPASQRPRATLGVPDWMDDAACKGKPSEVFFGYDNYGSGTGRLWDTSRAEAICAFCPVRSDCEQFAVIEGIHHGIWGGRTPKERRSRAGRVA